MNEGEDLILFNLYDKNPGKRGGIDTNISLMRNQDIFNNKHFKKVGMDRIAVLPDIRPFTKPDTGYPAGYPMGAGYRISGRIPDISMPARCSTELLK